MHYAVRPSVLGCRSTSNDAR